MAELQFHRMPGLLGPIFDAAGTGLRDFREALLLTFTFDPAFFESRLLGKLRATGAAVTVVADGAILAPDPRSLRAAGTQYTLGVAATAGAFHPKLFVLAGETKATIGIGSGNLTTSGWHANEELLTIAEADLEAGTPQIVAEVVSLLREVPSVVPMGPTAVAGVARTADRLDELVAKTDLLDTGHRLVSSLTSPILEQLPAQHAQHLRLSAPFYDRGGSALDALLDRFRPSKVTILAQPGRAVMNPSALRQRADTHGCELVYAELEGDEERRTRYRHGKLVEALEGDRVLWSLTGSPNISGAALLKDVRSLQGNFEIGVLSADTGALLPGPLQAVPREDALDNAIPASLDPDQVERPSGSRLLQANLVPGGIEIHLSGSAEEQVEVEISAFTSPPEVYEVLGQIPSGQDQAVLPGTFAPGSRVRVLGRVLPLHDPTLVVQRLIPSQGHRHNSDVTPAEIFASDTVATAWREALVQLLTTQQPGHHHGGGDSSSQEPAAHTGWSTLDEPDRWEEYTQDAVLRLGMPIFHLASGATPPAVVGAALSGAAPAWEDRFDDSESESFEGEEETAESVEADTENPAHPDPLTEHQRSRLRNFVRGIVELAPSLPPWERIAAVKLVILSTTTPVWDTEGAEWWPLTLGEALATLDEPRWPASSGEQAAAVAAVGLHRLRMAVPPDERGPVARMFKKVATALRPLLDLASLELVESNLVMLEGATLVARNADEVLDELSEALDPHARSSTLRVLSRVMPAMDFSWVSGNVLVAEGPARNPLAVATTALGEGNLRPPIAVAINGPSSWAVVAWTADHITSVQAKKGALPMFRTFDTKNRPFPLQVLRGGLHSLSTPPFTKPDELDLEVLAACGVTTWPVLPPDGSHDGE